ncbi:hypothetical protein ACS0TY_027174 [Phlomoides rotata]
MEKDWPPLKDCPQMKYGMINRYMRKFKWEDDPDDETITEYSSDEDEDGNRRKHVYTRSSMKKFLQQVRYTRGYDLDIWPPNCLDSPFDLVTSDELKCDEYQLQLNIAIELLIDHINDKTGKVYKYVDTLKFVDSTNRVYLMTFTAKEFAADAEEQTFLAAVFAPGRYKEEYEVLECFLRPEGPAPTDGMV